MALYDETDINTLKINLNRSAFFHAGVFIVDEDHADRYTALSR